MRFAPAIAVLAALADPAAAYQLKQSATGIPLRWDGQPIEIVIAVDDAPGKGGARKAAEAITAAFAAWDVPFAITLTEQHGTPPAAIANDGRNVVRFITDHWDPAWGSDALAITLTSHDPATGRITGADILINAVRHRWTAEACEAEYDLQNVVTHEIGHFLGLAHEPVDTEATMYASSGRCERKKRDLAGDDIAAVAYVYGELPPPYSPLVDQSSFGCAAAAGSRHDGVAGALVLLAALLLGWSWRRAQRSSRP